LEGKQWNIAKTHGKTPAKVEILHFISWLKVKNCLSANSVGHSYLTEKSSGEQYGKF